MTDHKELLELAARAMGYGFEIIEDHTWALKDGHNWYWNPLEDDGDCARMEVELVIDIEWRVTEGCAVAKARIDGDMCWRFEYFADHNNDHNAARRLASTRVAAEIGRRSPINET